MSLPGRTARPADRHIPPQASAKEHLKEDDRPTTRAEGFTSENSHPRGEYGNGGRRVTARSCSYALLKSVGIIRNEDRFCPKRKAVLPSRFGAAGAKCRALTDDGAEGIRPRTLKGFVFSSSPRGTSRLLYSNLANPFFLSCLILKWFPHSNPRLLYSSLSGVTCHPLTRCEAASSSMEADSFRLESPNAPQAT